MATSTRPGDLLASRYRLIDLLSESGGGRFWRAHDAVLERYVALHVISEDDPRAAGLIEAARASARVLDPRILRVLDAESRDGLCFVVNEWGTGTSLDILVATAGPLRPRPAAWMVAEVAAAIARTHDAGVAHGRLNPENVLIDRLGAVRIIGLCVDAALHGLPPGKPSLDRADLGGLLYCGLTGNWAGASASAVVSAHRAHGATLGPRQVLPRVPRSLDHLWREIDHVEHPHGHRWRLPAVGVEHPDVSSAQAIADRLVEYLGDTSGLGEELAASILPINEVRPVSLPAITDPPVRVPPPSPTPPNRSTPTTPPQDAPSEASSVSSASSASSAVDSSEPVGTADDDAPASESTATGTSATTTGEPTDPEEAVALGEPTDPGEVVDPTAADDPATAHPARASRVVPVTDLPTEAGMPVFGEGEDDVEWLRAGATPPPPPPPFEEPPERPLFAPDQPGDIAARRARAEAAMPTPVQIAAGTPGPGNFWPWDSEEDPTAERERVEDDDEVPGRSWLRLAMAVGLVVALLVAVVVAFNIGRGRSPLGGEEEDGPTRGSSPAPSVAPTPFAEVRARDFDPLGDDGAENSETAPLAVDGDLETAWRTQTYNDQFGTPLALKDGVGLMIDLGENRTVTEVEIALADRGTGDPAEVTVSVSRTAPQNAPGAATFGEAALDSPRLTLTAPTDAVSQGATTGRYVIVWFTSLPQVDGGYRAEVAEVAVRGH